MFSKEKELNCIRFIVFLTLLNISSNVFAEKPLTWDNIASVNVKEITKRAEIYLKENSTKLHGVKIKLLEVSAGYREGRKRLFASFFHDRSYVEGSEETIKAQTEQGEIEMAFYTFDIVVVKFDESGAPNSMEVFGQKSPGTKDDFKKLFKAR